MVTGTYIGNGEALGTVEAFILGDGRVLSVEALKQQAIGGAYIERRQCEKMLGAGPGTEPDRCARPPCQCRSGTTPRLAIGPGLAVQHREPSLLILWPLDDGDLSSFN
jgi:hypothetical protein